MLHTAAALGRSTSRPPAPLACTVLMAGPGACVGSFPFSISGATSSIPSCAAPISAATAPRVVPSTGPDVTMQVGEPGKHDRSEGKLAFSQRSSLAATLGPLAALRATLREIFGPRYWPTDRQPFMRAHVFEFAATALADRATSCSRPVHSAWSCSSPPCRTRPVVAVAQRRLRLADASTPSELLCPPASPYVSLGLRPAPLEGSPLRPWSRSDDPLPL
jgi:hypothetical protein